MTRHALIVVVVVFFGAVLAVATAFTVGAVVGGAQPKPVDQSIYNYGSP